MPAMEEASVGDFRKQQADYLNRVCFGGDVIKITKHGKILGVVISAEEYDRYMKAVEAAEGAADIKAADEALEEVGRSGTRSWEDVKKDLNMDV